MQPRAPMTALSWFQFFLKNLKIQLDFILYNRYEPLHLWRILPKLALLSPAHLGLTVAETIKNKLTVMGLNEAQLLQLFHLLDTVPW